VDRLLRQPAPAELAPAPPSDYAHKELGKTIFMVTHDPACAEKATVQRKLDKGALQ
jgi:hypothetical protein